MTTTPHTPRSVAAAAALVCTAILTTACGHPAGSTAGSTGTSTPTSATPATSHASSSSPAAPPGSPPPAAGATPCATRDLKVSAGVAQGALGSTYQVIDFTNIGSSRCTLYGFPGVSLAGGRPVKQIGAAAQESNVSRRQLVSLAPGQVANALVQIVDALNYPTARCHPEKSSYLQVYPPNQTTPAYLRYSATACASHVNTLTVTVVKPGAGSSA